MVGRKLTALDHLQSLFTFIDLAGTFAFAISGAVAARQRGLDLFGILVVSYTVACGGGIMRDLCIGAVPPIGLSDWRYLTVAIAAAIMTMGLNTLVKRLIRPVLVFDALGLALFAVTGATKSLSYGHNNQVALLLGVLTAVGGGVLRDILLNRVPVVLQKEIYASAALVGAGVVVVGYHFQWPGDLVFLGGFVLCFVLRILALNFRWSLPVFLEKQEEDKPR